MLGYVAAFVVGLIFGRATKSAPLTKNDDPQPSAAATLIKAMHGNEEAINFLQQVDELAEKGDLEAIGFMQDVQLVKLGLETQAALEEAATEAA